MLKLRRIDNPFKDGIFYWLIQGAPVQLNADNGDYGLLYDANDHLIDRPYSGDTHTGWCIVIIFNSEGPPRKERHRYLAPLRFVPASEIGDKAFHDILKKKTLIAVPLEVYPYSG